MAVVLTGSTYISACGGASNAISNHNTMFSGSSNSVAPLPTLPHHTGNRNSRWRSTRTKVPIFQPVEELATRFQIIILCFLGRAIQWRHSMLTWLCTSGYLSTSGLAATILNLSLPVSSDSIVGITVWLLDLNNIGLADGTALLLCVQLEFSHEEVITLLTNENGTPLELFRLFNCSSGHVLIKRMWILTWTQRFSKTQIIVNNVSKNRLSICLQVCELQQNRRWG